MKNLFLALCATPVIVSTIYAGNLPVEEIITRALERARRYEETKPDLNLPFVVTRTSEKLSRSGETKSVEHQVFETVRVGEFTYERLIEQNGKPLTEKEARQERKRRKDFIRDVQERLAQGKSPQPENENQVRFTRDFVGRYRTKLVGEETVRGYSCWVVEFQPREGKLPVRRRMDEALNRSTGRIWISEKEYGKKKTA